VLRDQLLEICVQLVGLEENSFAGGEIVLPEVRHQPFLGCQRRTLLTGEVLLRIGVEYVRLEHELEPSADRLDEPVMVRPTHERAHHAIALFLEP
jgi:hypothetical protein